MNILNKVKSILGFERQSVNIQGLAVADVVYHTNYGLGSYQPSNYKVLPKYRVQILFMDSSLRIVNKNSLFTVSKKERKHYWNWFARTQN